MHRFLQIAPEVGLSYLKVEEIDQLGSVSEQMQHLFLISKNIKPTSFKTLNRFKHLHTLVLVCEHGSSMGRVPQDLLYSVKQLRSLSLRRSGISEIPISIGSLKSLRYFDVSGTPIKCLPGSVVRLPYLQTLKLDGCANLVGLPFNISKLTNLRHLEFDIHGPMPAKMGNLTNLQTLRSFPMGTEDGCHIVELKHLVNLRGSFRISMLENVLSSHEAKEATMTDKKYLRELELRWGYRCSGSSKDDEEMLDFLKPTACLQKLRILCYNGSIFPSWINNGSYLCNIIDLTLQSCRNCLVLPSLGGLPSLKVLDIVEFTEVRFIDNHFRRSYGNKVECAFAKLEKLTIGGMPSLEEWSGVENGDFPCLSYLRISSCPKLVALEWLSFLCSLKSLEISSCEKVSLPANYKLSSLLEYLSITKCPNLKKIFCKREASGASQIAHVPFILMDFEKIKLKGGED